MARLKCPAPHACLCGHNLARSWCRVCLRRWCDDHIHIVTMSPRTVSQANLVEQIKKVPSKWIKALDVRYRGFFWQRGYGVFGEPESAESRAGVRAGAARPPSHRQLSGGVSRAIAPARDRFRRAVFALSALLVFDSTNAGGCPRLVVSCAFGAKRHPHQPGSPIPATANASSRPRRRSGDEFSG